MKFILSESRASAFLGMKLVVCIAIFLQTVLADAYENITGIVVGDIVNFKLNPAKYNVDRRWPNVEYYRTKNIKLVSEVGKKVIGDAPAGSVAVNYFKNFLDADALVFWNQQTSKVTISRMNTTNDCTMITETEYELPKEATIKFAQFARSKADFRFLSHNVYFTQKGANPGESVLKYLEKGQSESSESVWGYKLEAAQLDKFTYWNIGAGNNFSLIAPLNLQIPDYLPSKHLFLLEVGLDENTNRTEEVIHDLAAALARVTITGNFQFSFATVVETSMKSAAAVTFGYKSVVFGGKDFLKPNQVILYNCILEKSKDTQCMEFFKFESAAGQPEVLFVDSGETNSTTRLVPTRVVLRVPDSVSGTFTTHQFVVNYTLTITSAPDVKEASQITFTRSIATWNNIPVPYNWLNLSSSCLELVQDRVLNLYKGSCGQKENFMLTLVEDKGYSEKPKTYSGTGKRNNKSVCVLKEPKEHQIE